MSDLKLHAIRGVPTLADSGHRDISWPTQLSLGNQEVDLGVGSYPLSCWFQHPPTVCNTFPWYLLVCLRAELDRDSSLLRGPSRGGADSSRLPRRELWTVPVDTRELKHRLPESTAHLVLLTLCLEVLLP